MKDGNYKLRLSLGDEQIVLLICMGIALLFWGFVKLSKTYQTDSHVDVTYQLPPGLDFAESPVKKLNATFSGQGWQLLVSYLFKDDVNIDFDITKYNGPFIEKDELLRKIAEQSRLQVMDVSPSNLSLALDKTNVRKVPVVLDKDLVLETDFFVSDSILINPDSVVVWGPVNSLQDIEFIMAEKLSISGLRASVSQTLSLIIPSGKYLNLSASSVDVYIPVEQFTEKTFQVPVIVNGLQDSIQIVPAFVQLTCVVALSHYETTTETDFTVEANLLGRVPGGNQNTAAILATKQPSWVRSVRFTPNFIEYFFVK